MTVEFHYGVFADTFEKQANEQGFTFGDNAEWIDEVGQGLIGLWVHGCLTDKEYDKVRQRFQNKILIANIKRIEKHE